MTNAKRVTTKDLMKEIENLKLKVMEVDNLKRKIAVLEKCLQTLKNGNGFKVANEPSEKDVQCTKCDKMFCTVDDLRRHEKSKHDWAPINCNLCDKFFL